MYAMIDEHKFAEEMKDYGFSLDGADALFHFLEACNLDTPHGMKFDPVAIRCDWNEGFLPNILEQYDYINTLEELCKHTTVLVVDAEKDLYIYNTAF